jgi:hypothetical protein
VSTDHPRDINIKGNTLLRRPFTQHPQPPLEVLDARKRVSATVGGGARNPSLAE